MSSRWLLAASFLLSCTCSPGRERTENETASGADAGSPDAGCTELDLFVDLDGDGWGDDAMRVRGCAVPGLVARGGDCDDQAAAVHPTAEEICGNGIDDDCEGGDGASGFRWSTAAAPVTLATPAGWDAGLQSFRVATDAAGSFLVYSVGGPMKTSGQQRWRDQWRTFFHRIDASGVSAEPSASMDCLFSTIAREGDGSLLLCGQETDEYGPIGGRFSGSVQVYRLSTGFEQLAQGDFVWSYPSLGKRPHASITAVPSGAVAVFASGATMTLRRYDGALGRNLEHVTNVTNVTAAQVALGPDGIGLLHGHGRPDIGGIDPHYMTAARFALFDDSLRERAATEDLLDDGIGNDYVTGRRSFSLVASPTRWLAGATANRRGTVLLALDEAPTVRHDETFETDEARTFSQAVWTGTEAGLLVGWTALHNDLSTDTHLALHRFDEAGHLLQTMALRNRTEGSLYGVSLAGTGSTYDVAFVAEDGKLNVGRIEAGVCGD